MNDAPEPLRGISPIEYATTYGLGADDPRARMLDKIGAALMAPAPRAFVMLGGWPYIAEPRADGSPGFTLRKAPLVVDEDGHPVGSPVIGMEPLR